MSRRTWEKDRFIELVKTCKTKADVIRGLGLSLRPGNYRTVDIYVEKWGLDTSHFTGQAHGTSISPHKVPDEEMFVENSLLRRLNVRRRVIRYNLIEYLCSLCGQRPEWKGKEMSLILDHINGINNDHRLENLRFICPNCNATLPTHCGKNIKLTKERIKMQEEKRKFYLTCSCGSKKDKKSKCCISCHNKKNKQKIEWPSVEELLQRAEEIGYSALGRELGVSDNAIRKHIKVRSNNGV